MARPVILTGLRANNDLHIGNYFGALLPLVDMAKKRAGEYQINLFVPDLHSFTTPIDHSKLQSQIMQNLRVFVAAGLPLNDENINIYRQSYIPAHSELTWILGCFTGFGEMSRMTQFKDKSQRIIATGPGSVNAPVKDSDGELVFDEEKQLVIEKEHTNRITVGLFNYPVLMAADILLYGAEYVPVGDDQTQHLEFTRDIAERMNSKFGKLFVVPKPVKEQHKFFGKDQGLRIRDLQNPTKKMSKSNETGKGIIFLSDEPAAASKKLMAAETDSLAKINYDYVKQPGVSNLLEIYKLLDGDASEFTGQTQYGPLKQAVASKIEAFLTDFQAKLANVDEAKLSAKLETSEAKMKEVASAKLLEVQKAVGLRP